MKANKLFRDVRPEEQPKETYPFGKNGIQFDLNGASFNEPGFRRLQVLAPYKIHGIIGSDKKMIIFSTDNTNSAVGYFNPETELYEPIIDDNPTHLVNWPDDDSRIGFKAENYITGEAQRNYKGEVVVTFTDKHLYPMYLNCDDPSISSVDDLRLFAFFRTPDIKGEETVGGNLPSGAYFIAVGYERNDGTSTPYSSVSDVVILTPSQAGAATDKALTITINNADTSYDFIRLAIISKVEGVTKAVELLDYLPVTAGTIEFTYTGDQLTQEVDVTTILVKPAIYSKVGAIGQLNDYLFIGNLETEPDINDMQPYALAIGIEFQSELINATAPPPEHVNGTKRSMMHQEVYALYVRYRKTRGGFTKWFTIPGNTPTSADLANSTEATTGGAVTPVPKFKVEDTIPYFDTASKVGGTGIWRNDTEKYPDTADFDATAVGGRNLRDQPVLHHKMPSLKWCKDTFYPAETAYGVTHLDLLGIRATNVRIPDKYIGILDGYEIGYARRTVGNMTNYGQSVLMHGVVNAFDQNKPTDGGATIYTSGGNWRTSIWHKGDNSFNNDFELVQLRTDTFRFHAFDVLFNKPSIEPTFISNQYKLTRNSLREEGYIEDGQNNANMPIAILVDYTKGSMITTAQTGKYLRRIKESTYMPNGINTLGFVNARHEATFAGTLAGPDWGINYGDAGLRVKGQSFTEAEVGCPPFEQTYLINLIAVKTDIYNRFYSQTMASMGQAKDLSSTETFWGGDTFVCDYTFHTYGRHETNDGWGDGNKGKKVIRRFVCESASNIHLRYEIIGNQYSKWYPKEPVTLNPDEGNNNTYVINFDRAQDPNQFGYNKSLNSLNDLLDSTIFSPFREELTKFPYRIHRGGRLIRTGRPRSWRTFLPLDYYEMQKNMGFIINLEGMDDRLLIHMENSLFATQNKAVLRGEQIDVTLGSGDIFQFEPQEVISSKLGHAGTQHDLACVRTPMGYVFIDAKQGEMYLYKGSLDLLNPGLNIFLRQYLKIKDTNVFMGNGATIGFDPKYKRFLLTVKNRKMRNNVVVKEYSDTAEFWANLEVGDIIYYMNRYVQYQGINNPGSSGVDCPTDPPEPVITWEPINPYCLTSDGKNIGMQGWLNRRRLVDGIPDGVTEPNTTNGGQGTYFPPVSNIDDCPIPPPNITWVGQDAFCILATGSACPDGWTLSPDGTYCSRETVEPATPPSGGGGTPGIAAKAEDDEWNNGGARLYEEGFASDGSGTNTLIETPHIWVNGNSPFDPGSRNTTDSRMNYAGLWVQGGMSGGEWQPQNEWIGFSRKITLPAAKTVYIGMCADNNFRVALNGVDLVTNLVSNNFNYMHIYPVDLRAGDNFIEMYARNTGSVAGFAMEIYDATAAELQGASSNAEIDGWLIFSTKDMVGEPFDLGDTIGWSCPSGWVLDTSGAGDPVCRLLETMPPDEVPDGNTGDKGFATRCRLVDNVPDGFCEPNTESGGVGPYIEPVEDLNACPIDPPDPEQPIIVTGTLQKMCSDRNCTQQGSVSLQFTFTAPTPANLEIHVGQLVIFNNLGEVRYSGSDIFTPPVGALPWTPYYNPVTAPFIITIPAGVTTFTVPQVIYTQVNHAVGGYKMPWICQSCHITITDIYLKIDSPETGYALNISAASAGFTVHNQNS